MSAVKNQCFKKKNLCDIFNVMINKFSLFKAVFGRFSPKLVILPVIILFSCLFLMSQTLYDPMQQQKAELIKLLEKNFNITDKAIITALQSVNREDFLPQEMKKYAYIDISLPIDNSNVIISYSDLMKAVTSLKNSSREKALVIGRNSDFTTAILSFLYKQVYQIEFNTASGNKDGNKDDASARGKYSNVITVFSKDYNYFSTYGPFDLVFVNSSITEFKSNYADLLTQNGEAIFALADIYGFNMLHKATKTGLSYSITTLGEAMFPSSN